MRLWAELVPDQVTFKNCYRVRKLMGDEDEATPVPHCSTFMKRPGLFLRVCPCHFAGLASLGSDALQTSERLPRTMRSDTDREDVFCLVKSEMASTTLSQPALLVWPSVLRAASSQFIRDVNTTRKVDQPKMDPDRRSELERLAGSIQRDFPHMRRAVAWYKTMLARTDAPAPLDYPQLTFLQNAPADDPPLDVMLGERRAQQKPHPLQVVFHRR